MIIDIEQLMINHNTYNIAEQYVWHVRTCLDTPICGHAPRDRQTKIIYSIYSKSRPDALIIFHATLSWLNPSLKMHKYVAVHNLL